MAVIEELIRLEDNGSISFGNYLMDEKKKVLDFEVCGNLYKVKTYKDITKLEKNGKMLLETVPGATVHNFAMNGKKVEFSVESDDDVQITMELEPEKEYKLVVNDMLVGKINSNIGGKINFSVELNNNSSKVKIEKI
ncbi:MAG: endosialidase [Candidatus Metalachnospira sp.]|nr:endosialidase [Candidatus Metalachnospira sp.]